MDETCAAMVRYSLVPVVDSHPEYAQSRFRETAFWAEVDMAHAVLQMRRVRRDEQYRAAIGSAAKQRARARNADCASAPVELLRALLEEKILAAAPRLLSGDCLRYGYAELPSQPSMVFELR